MKKFIKQILRALPAPLLKYLILAKLFILNHLTAFKKQSTTDWVCTIEGFDPVQRLNYAKEVFNDYFSYSGVRPENLKGKKVLEIGPGENFAVALMCLAHDAEKVVCLDRFPSLIDRGHQFEIYELLAKEFENSSFLKIQDGKYEIDPHKLEYLAGTPLEKLSDTVSEKFDIIISRAVLEHVYDLGLAFESMNKLLAPEGIMIHEVDFRDHAIFTSYNLHPLTFLTFSSRAWITSTNNLGAPNRKLENHFRMLLDKYGYSYDLLKILAVGSDNKFHEYQLQVGKTHEQRQVDLINGIRNKLAKEYKNLPESDLLTSGIYFTARKA